MDQKDVNWRDLDYYDDTIRDIQKKITAKEKEIEKLQKIMDEMDINRETIDVRSDDPVPASAYRNPMYKREK